MKLILTTILLLISFSSYSQDWLPLGKPVKTVKGLAKLQQLTLTHTRQVSEHKYSLNYEVTDKDGNELAFIYLINSEKDICETVSYIKPISELNSIKDFLIEHNTYVGKNENGNQIWETKDGKVAIILQNNIGSDNFILTAILIE